MEYWDKDRNMLQVWWLKKNGTKELLREVHYDQKPWVTFPEKPTPDYCITKVPEFAVKSEGKKKGQSSRRSQQQEG